MEGIIGGIILALIAAIATWITARRTTKGDVGTSTASDLWETLREELKASRSEVALLKTEAVQARAESVALREETLKLREEMILLRADAAQVHAHLKECLAEITEHAEKKKGVK